MAIPPMSRARDHGRSSFAKASEGKDARAASTAIGQMNLYVMLSRWMTCS
jgi:hypothetical protein